MSAKKATVLPLPAVGDQVVVLGTVDHIDTDGLIFVKLLDRTLGPGAEYVARLAFWSGAVFPLEGSGIATSRGFSQCLEKEKL
jgi:hypothetical protein